MLRPPQSCVTLILNCKYWGDTSCCRAVSFFPRKLYTSLTPTENSVNESSRAQPFRAHNDPNHKCCVLVLFFVLAENIVRKHPPLPQDGFTLSFFHCIQPSCGVGCRGGGEGGAGAMGGVPILLAWTPMPCKAATLLTATVGCEVLKS